MGDGVDLRRGIAVQYGGAIGLAPSEKGGIIDQTVFHHLGITGHQLAARQCGEHGRIDQYGDRLMEGADQILAGLGVDRRLAAHAAVHLREQGGRHLHETAAALQHRTGKADQIANHTAAQRDDRIAAFDAEFQQPFDDQLQMRPILGGFTGRQHDRL